MNLTDEGKALGRKFRDQAKFYLEILQHNILHDEDIDANYNANMATLSLLGAVLAYLDPEYKPERHEH